MHAAGSDGLAQAVVGVILVVRELLLPALDERRRHRLCADVHQPPLGQLILIHIHGAGIDGIQDILGPGHQQPDDGALLLGDCSENHLRLRSLQEHGLAAGHERTEPVHLRAGVVQRRDAEEHVVPACAVVNLLHLGGMHQTLVIVQDGLREPCGSGGEIDGRIVLVVNPHEGRLAGAVRHQLKIILREGRAVLSHIDEETVHMQLLLDGLHTADKLRPEEHHIHLREIRAVENLIGGIAEVEGHGDGAGLQNTEIDGKPLQAVHHQDGNLLSTADAAGKQEIGHPVGLLVENSPGNLSPVGNGGGRLDQGIFLPGNPSRLLLSGIQLHQGNLVSVELAVSLKVICNRHVCISSILSLFTFNT